MMIKMPCYQRDIDVTAFTNRLAVIQRFENREPARMFLYLPRQCIEIARTRMRRDGLPRGNAARAAFTALSTSAADPCATVASFSPVEGSVVFEITPAAGACHAP